MSHIVRIVCSNCEQEGHRLRTCPEPRKSRSRGCRNCDSEDHLAADCDQPRKPREGEVCHNCGSDKHYGKDCTEERKPRADNRACHNCLETGHLSKECLKPRLSRGEREARDEATNVNGAFDCLTLDPGQPTGAGQRSYAEGSTALDSVS